MHVSDKRTLHLPLRLEAIVRMVSRVDCVADIGSDHGLVPLALVGRGIVGRAIAIEVALGPLQAVKAAFERQHYRLEARLGDGMQPLRQGEVQGVVVAGMGGATIWRILTDAYAGKLLKADLPELVLQPMDAPGLIRWFARRSGYEIDRDVWLGDRGISYNVLRLTAPAAFREADFAGAYDEFLKLSIKSRVELEYGSAVYDLTNAAFAAHWRLQVAKHKRIVAHLERSVSVEAKRRYAQVMEWLDGMNRLRPFE